MELSSALGLHCTVVYLRNVWQGRVNHYFDHNTWKPTHTLSILCLTWSVRCHNNSRHKEILLEWVRDWRRLHHQQITKLFLGIPRWFLFFQGQSASKGQGCLHEAVQRTYTHADTHTRTHTHIMQPLLFLSNQPPYSTNFIVFFWLDTTIPYWQKSCGKPYTQLPRGGELTCWHLWAADEPS